MGKLQTSQIQRACFSNMYKQFKIQVVSTKKQLEKQHLKSYNQVRSVYAQ